MFPERGKRRTNLRRLTRLKLRLFVVMRCYLGFGRKRYLAWQHTAHGNRPSANTCVAGGTAAYVLYFLQQVAAALPALRRGRL